MTAQELFYPKDPVVGRLLSLPPHILFTSLSLAAVFFLILPAWIFGVLSIPRKSGNVGFWYSFNWSLMYLLVVPLIFAMTSHITRSIPRRLDAVTRPGKSKGCIVPRGANNASDYAADFQKSFSRWSKPIMAGAFIFALLVDAGDSWPLWTALIHKSSLASDWSSAYALPAGNYWSPPGFLANLSFDLISYIFQGAYLFLAFYWMSKYTFFFVTFCDLMIPRNAPYKFVPQSAAPDMSMGLRPLSFFFNSLLMMTCMFLAFIVYHRFQLMELYCRLPFPQFASQVLQAIKTDPWALLNLQNPFYGLQCMNTGMMLMLVFLVFPIVVIAFFPLGVLRHYAKEQRDDALQDLGAELEEALTSHKDNQAEVVKNLDDRIRRLQSASLWPISDRTAVTVLPTVMVLAVGAWLPPVLVLVFAGLGVILLDKGKEFVKSKL